jgi:hypothetical protein
MRLVFTAGRRAHLFVTPVSHPDAPTTAFTQRQLPIPLLNEVQARMQQHMLPMEWYIVDDDLALSDKGWKPPKQSKTPLGGTFVWSLPSPAVASSPASTSSPPSRASGSTASTSSEPAQNAVHVDDEVVHDQETDWIEGAERVYIAVDPSAHIRTSSLRLGICRPRRRSRRVVRCCKSLLGCIPRKHRRRSQR